MIPKVMTDFDAGGVLDLCHRPLPFTESGGRDFDMAPALAFLQRHTLGGEAKHHTRNIYTPFLQLCTAFDTFHLTIADISDFAGRQIGSLYLGNS